VVRRISYLVLSMTLVLLVAGACGPPQSPEERVAELRSRYDAMLNGFVVNQAPVEEAMAEEMPMEMEAEEAAEPAMEEGEMMAEPMPLLQEVLLDILVSTTSRETLPGLTVDITQVDAEKNVKQTWRVYLDTSAVHRGPGTQITHRLEGVEYQEGDGFNVEVRHPVPPEERGEYQEFQAAPAS
jgi:hypothetical protein